jgi:hypothetical protein
VIYSTPKQKLTYQGTSSILRISQINKGTLVKQKGSKDINKNTKKHKDKKIKKNKTYMAHTNSKNVTTTKDNMTSEEHVGNLYIHTNNFESEQIRKGSFNDPFYKTYSKARILKNEENRQNYYEKMGKSSSILQKVTAKKHG